MPSESELKVWQAVEQLLQRHSRVAGPVPQGLARHETLMAPPWKTEHIWPRKQFWPLFTHVTVSPQAAVWICQLACMQTALTRPAPAQSS